MAITTMDQLAEALGSAYRVNFHKDPVTGVVAGDWRSFWNVAGRPSAGGYLSAGNGRVCSQGNPAGVMPLYRNPSAGQTGYAGQLSVQGDATGSLLIYDRLLDLTYNGASATGQAISYAGSSTINRPVGDPSETSVIGHGELWFEAQSTTATGAFTAAYVDQAGVSKVTPSFVTPNAKAAGTMLPVPLAGSDIAVRTVSQVNVTGVHGAAQGLVVLRRIAQLEISAANIGRAIDAVSLGLPRIASDLCLSFAFCPTGTGLPRMVGHVSTIVG